MLGMDLPIVASPGADAETLDLRCEVCGDSEWWSCAPGTASDATRWHGVMEFRALPEAPMHVWCQQHWVERFGSVVSAHA
jgi:hypothetical protein